MELKSVHNFPPEVRLTQVVETDIGMLYFYKNILVLEGKEGVTLSYKTAFSVLLKSLQLLGPRPWVFISNRVNSYSISPTDFSYLNRVPTLKAIAIVNYTDSAKQNAELETQFCKKPNKNFDKIEDAYNWAKTFL